MAISKKQVEHVANLSKLSFSQAELGQLTEDLGKMIDMVEQLAEVETRGVPFTSNALEIINVLREDLAEPGTARAELLKNVPESEDGYIKVPAIIDNGEAGA